MRLRQIKKVLKHKMLTVKVTPSELDKIQLKADKYTDGNVSEWIRYAAIELDPRARDIIP